MAQVTIKTGFDVDYYLDQVGADYYLTAAGEPPGIWAGAAAPGLGLVGQVDPDVMRALYHHDTAPDGVPLGTAQRGPKYRPRSAPISRSRRTSTSGSADELGELAPHMPDRVRTIRLEERAKTRTRTPYYDMTFSAEKSVSLAYAGLAARPRRTARDEGRGGDAERLEARARSVEAAVMAGRRRDDRRTWSGAERSSAPATTARQRRVPRRGRVRRGEVPSAHIPFG